MIITRGKKKIKCYFLPKVPKPHTRVTYFFFARGIFAIVTFWGTVFFFCLIWPLPPGHTFYTCVGLGIATKQSESCLVMVCVIYPSMTHSFKQPANTDQFMNHMLDILPLFCFFFSSSSAAGGTSVLAPPPPTPPLSCLGTFPEATNTPVFPPTYKTLQVLITV